MKCLYCNDDLEGDISYIHNKIYYKKCPSCIEVGLGYFIQNNIITHIEFAFYTNDNKGLFPIIEYIMELSMIDNEITIFYMGSDIMIIPYIPKDLNSSNAKFYLDKFLKLAAFS